MKNRKTAIVILIYGIVLFGNIRVVFAQQPADQSFIRLDKNVIETFSPEVLDLFFHKMDSLIRYGRGKIVILHIGDSHIQADYFSGQLRKKIQEFIPGANGDRGLVFPYNIAKSNNPFNYRVEYSGKWETCRSIEKNKVCQCGVTGYQAYTSDSSAWLKIWFKTLDYPPYVFNIVRIFSNYNQSSYKPVIVNSQVEYIDSVSNPGCVVFLLGNYIDTLMIRIVKRDSLQRPFRLYGISLENDFPGLVYHAAGQNGADASCYSHCDLLEEQILALAPDLIIVSLGTNDANSAKFDPDVFRVNYENLIGRLHHIAPKASLLLTSPGDSYRKRRYPNKNIPVVADIINQTAKYYQQAFWDFYTVMGGYTSIVQWYKSGLTANDKLHFNREGYTLQGDLLFDAIIQAWEKHLPQPNTE